MSHFPTTEQENNNNNEKAKGLGPCGQVLCLGSKALRSPEQWLEVTAGRRVWIQTCGIGGATGHPEGDVQQAAGATELPCKRQTPDSEFISRGGAESMKEDKISGLMTTAESGEQPQLGGKVRKQWHQKQNGKEGGWGRGGAKELRKQHGEGFSRDDQACTMKQRC